MLGDCGAAVKKYEEWLDDVRRRREELQVRWAIQQLLEMYDAEVRRMSARRMSVTPDEFYEKWLSAWDEHMQRCETMQCEPCQEHADAGGSAACRACRWTSDGPRPTTAPASEKEET